MLQQLCRLRKQVHGHQPLDELADHLIALRTDGREFLVVIEKAERLDGAKLLCSLSQKQRLENRTHLGCSLPGFIRVREVTHRKPHRVHAFPHLVLLDIELSEFRQGPQLHFISTPLETQTLQAVDGLLCVQRTGSNLEKCHFKRSARCDRADR